MALTHEQKKELVEAGVVVVAAIVLFMLFRSHGGGATVPLLTPTSADLTPYANSAGGVPSITYNYPGSPFNDPGLPPASPSPATSFGFGDENIAGNNLQGGNVGGSNLSFGGAGGIGGNTTSIGDSTVDGGSGFDMPAFPDIHFPGMVPYPPPGDAGQNGCGCCNGPPANGDAFPTPQAAVDFMQARMPRVPQIAEENPYNFGLTQVDGRYLPANSVITDTGQTMTLADYNRTVESMNLAAQYPGTNETPAPQPAAGFPAFARQLSNSFLGFFGK